MFNAFDSWVLAKMQKFCDIFQVVTGITKYAVTKWGMILRTFGFVSLVTIYAVPGANTLLKTLFVLFALSVVTDCLITIKRLELEEKHFLKTGQMLGWTEHNFNRPWFRLFHFPFMIQSVFTLGSGSGIAYFCTVLGVMLAYYAGSCMPRPPSKSTLRKWYEKGLTWLSEKLPDDPEPHPA